MRYRLAFRYSSLVLFRFLRSSPAVFVCFPLLRFLRLRLLKGGYGGGLTLGVNSDLYLGRCVRFKALHPEVWYQTRSE